MAQYMPQWYNGESWNDLWFSPCNYDRARSIRDMLIRNGDDRKSLRIIAVV